MGTLDHLRVARLCTVAPRGRYEVVTPDRDHGIQAGAYEGIMLNWEGYVAEGTISNLFTVKKCVLQTPHLDTGILEGVTRGLVLFLAKKEHIQTKEAMLKPKDLYDADECFITNSTVEIMPVTTVDGKKIGEGVPGPVTRALMIAYTSEVMRHV